MTDEDVLALSANAPVVYVDELICIRRENGVLRCIGVLNGVGPQVTIIISLAGVDRANRAIRRVLDGPCAKDANQSLVWEGDALVHH